LGISSVVGASNRDLRVPSVVRLSVVPVQKKMNFPQLLPVWKLTRLAFAAFQNEMRKIDFQMGLPVPNLIGRVGLVFVKATC